MANNMIAYTANKFRKFYFDVVETVSTFFTRIIITIYGVRISKDCRFIGLPRFYRTHGSSIAIDTGCTFNSTASWNLLGCYKQCIIATLTPVAEIKIGVNCGFSGTSIGSFESVEIGDNCIIGANTIITDSDWHCLKPNNRFTGEIKTSPVIIKNNVFIGANSIILKGTTIGENTIIGAGSVVAGNIPSNVIAAGNPCKIIKQI